MEETVRGGSWAARMRTRAPASARRSAQVSPFTPAPMTVTRALESSWLTALFCHGTVQECDGDLAGWTVGGARFALTRGWQAACIAPGRGRDRRDVQAMQDSAGVAAVRGAGGGVYAGARARAGGVAGAGGVGGANGCARAGRPAGA